MVNCLQCKSDLVTEHTERVLVTCPECEFIFALSPGGSPEIPTYGEEEGGLQRISARQAVSPGMAPDQTVLGDTSDLFSELDLPRDKELYVEVLAAAPGGHEPGTIIRFTKGRMVMGRSAADIVIEDDRVSRKHCAVEAISRENIYLRDLASTNGTYLNGHRVTVSKIRPGDEIRLGQTRLRFEAKG